MSSSISIRPVYSATSHAIRFTTGVALRFPVTRWGLRLLSFCLTRSLDVVIITIARISKGRSSSSPWTKGRFAPQLRELIERNPRISGTLPSDLCGMFVTVGANPHYLPIGGYHIFEGDGAITATRIYADGSASVSYTHIATQKLAVDKSNRRCSGISLLAGRGFSGLLLFLLSSLRRKLQFSQYSPSTANTNIDVHGNRVFALWEGDWPYELKLSADGAALQVARKIDFTQFKGGPFSAHPAAHPTNGCWYSVSYNLETPDYDAAVVVVDRDFNFLRAVPIHLGHKPMIHDGIVTQKYVVILDLSFEFSPEEIMKKDGYVFRFRHGKPARIGLMPVESQHEGDIIWFDVPPFMCFHILGAWDTDNGVVLYLSKFDDFDLSGGFELQQAELCRYDLNVRTRKAATRIEPLELPKHFGGVPCVFDFPFTTRGSGRCAKYAFGTVFTDPGDGVAFNAGLAKYNLETQTIEGVIHFEVDGNTAEAIGEAQFAAREGSTSEDNGYLCVHVRDAKGNIGMNIYDAVTMKSQFIARVHAPDGFHIPNSFHSQFIGESMLRQLRN